MLSAWHPKRPGLPTRRGVAQPGKGMQCCCVARRGRDGCSVGTKEPARVKGHGDACAVPRQRSLSHAERALSIACLRAALCATISILPAASWLRELTCPAQRCLFSKSQVISSIAPSLHPVCPTLTGLNQVTATPLSASNPLRPYIANGTLYNRTFTIITAAQLISHNRQGLACRCSSRSHCPSKPLTGAQSPCTTARIGAGGSAVTICTSGKISSRGTAARSRSSRCGPCLPGRVRSCAPGGGAHWGGMWGKRPNHRSAHSAHHLHYQQQHSHQHPYLVGAASAGGSGEARTDVADRGAELRIRPSAHVVRAKPQCVRDAGQGIVHSVFCLNHAD